MKDAIKKFPWFEVILIVGLAVALIVKPQTPVFSASPETTGTENVRGGGGAGGILPLSAATQPDGRF